MDALIKALSSVTLPSPGEMNAIKKAGCSKLDVKMVWLHQKRYLRQSLFRRGLTDGAFERKCAAMLQIGERNYHYLMKYV